MEEAFGTIIVVVTVVSAVIAMATLGLRSKAYDQIGRGGMSLRDGSETGPDEPTASGAVSVAQRDEEVRQMLGARNERRARRGLAPLDVEAELARLTAPALDPALEGEVRSLVVARNERRARRGQAPLDVESEVRRQLAELGG